MEIRKLANDNLSKAQAAFRTSREYNKAIYYHELVIQYLNQIPKSQCEFNDYLNMSISYHEIFLAKNIQHDISGTIDSVLKLLLNVIKFIQAKLLAKEDFDSSEETLISRFTNNIIFQTSYLSKKIGAENYKAEVQKFFASDSEEILSLLKSLCEKYEFKKGLSAIENAQKLYMNMPKRANLQGDQHPLSTNTSSLFQKDKRRRGEAVTDVSEVKPTHAYNLRSLGKR